MSGLYDEWLVDEEEEEEKARRNVYAEFVDKPEQKSLHAGDPMQTFGNVVSKTVRSFPEATMNLLESLGTAIAKPKETGKAFKEMGGSLLRKGQRNVQELASGTEIEPKDEVAADIAIEHMKKRYGGFDQLVNTVTTDPAGFLSDLSMIPRLGVDPLTVASRIAQKTGKNIPTKMYKNAAGIEPSSLERGDKIAQVGMRDGIPVSTKGFAKIEKMRKDIGKRMNDAIENSNQFQPIPTKVVTAPLDALIKESKYLANPAHSQKMIKMKENFDKQFGNKKNMFPDELQDWKKSAYDEAYARDADPTVKVTDPKTKAYREMGRGAKTSLETRVPDLKKPNQEWADISSLKPYIKNRIDSIADADPTMASVVRRVLNTPKIQGNVARILNKIQRGEMGWLEKNLNTHEIRAMIALAGRNQQTLEEELVY